MQESDFCRDATCCDHKCQEPSCELLDACELVPDEEWPSLKADDEKEIVAERTNAASADADFVNLFWTLEQTSFPATGRKHKPVWGSKAWAVWMARVDLEDKCEPVISSPPDAGADMEATESYGDDDTICRAVLELDERAAWVRILWQD